MPDLAARKAGAGSLPPAAADELWEGLDPVPASPASLPEELQAAYSLDTFGSVIARGAAPESLVYYVASPLFPIDKWGAIELHGRERIIHAALQCSGHSMYGLQGHVHPSSMRRADCLA